MAVYDIAPLFIFQMAMAIQPDIDWFRPVRHTFMGFHLYA